MLRALPWLAAAVALVAVGVAALVTGFHVSGVVLLVLAASPLVVGLGTGLAVRLHRT